MRRWRLHRGPTMSIRSRSADVRSLVDEFRSIAPGFQVDASSIEIMNSPGQFYQSLLSGIRSSSSRITLSSLYLGNGPLEADLVQELHNRMQLSPFLKLRVLLDYHRGQRRSVDQSSSVDILKPMLESFPQRMRLNLFRVPQLSSLHDMILSPRWKEVIGVQHMKLYVFDDVTVISGANLSEQYFVNRQDRYYKIHDQRLANFVHQLVQGVAESSFRFIPGNPLQPPIGPPDLHAIIKRSISGQREISDVNSNASSVTWIFPTIQMAPLGMRQDQKFTEQLLQKIETFDSITLASGYLNLTQRFESLVQSFQGQVTVCTASPEANAFYNANGVSKNLPDAYSAIVRSFLRRLPASSRVRMYEYYRDGWTYHQKGLWIVDDRKTGNPALTLIGSSNFGQRSMERDLECQFCIISNDNSLRERLNQERQQAMTHMTQVDLGWFEQPRRQLGVLIRIITSLVRSYL